MRKLIIYGNCQAGALYNLLRKVPSVNDRWHISFHELWKTGIDLDRQVAEFADADIFLQQNVRNWRHHPLNGNLSNEIHIVRFPFLYVASLWPFDSFVAGQDAAMLNAANAHNANSSEPFRFGFQDGIMCGLRLEIPDPEERLRRYRALEFDNVPDIARYAEFEEARLLNDDQLLQLTIGRFIVERYRNIRLFHAITHPAALLIERLAWEILKTLGINIAFEDAPSLFDNFKFMESYQVPLHPKVIEALGLRWVTPDSRYAQLDGVPLTFDEYFTKYARFELTPTQS